MTRSAVQAASKTRRLEDVLEQLPMDNELRRIVEEGAQRLSDAEANRVADNFEHVLTSLPTVNAALKRTLAAAEIGPGLHVIGEVTADEQVIIKGTIEGTIRVPNHEVVIAENSQVNAHIIAKSVNIHGAVTGSVTAHDGVALSSTASLDGDIRAPRVSIGLGAYFKGSVASAEEQTLSDRAAI